MLTVPTFWTPRRRRGEKITLLEGRGSILDVDGKVIEESPWMPNSLADEGEQNVLNTWLLEQAHLSKYLALLTVDPSETTTMATMTELLGGPGTGGYSRQQGTSGQWITPALNAGDYQTELAEKTFGPATVPWVAFNNVAMVTTATGTAGKFLLFVALSGATSLLIGQSFKYTLRVKAQ